MGPDEPAPLGIPIFTRIRNASLRRDVDSYTALQRSVNAYLGALAGEAFQRTLLAENQTALLTARAALYARMERLQDLRDRAYEAVGEEIDNARRDARITALTKDLTIKRLERQLAEERRAADAAGTPATESAVSKLDATFAQVRQVVSAIDGHIADLIHAAGGEDRLDEAARRHIDQLRVFKSEKIPALYEGLLE